MPNSKFYGNIGYASYSGNGYTAHFQTCLFDEFGVPFEVEWNSTQAKYLNHAATTSTANPYLTDPNAYYATDLTPCMGFSETGEHNFCEY